VVLMDHRILSLHQLWIFFVCGFLLSRFVAFFFASFLRSTDAHCTLRICICIIFKGHVWKWRRSNDWPCYFDQVTGSLSQDSVHVSNKKEWGKKGRDFWTQNLTLIYLYNHVVSKYSLHPVSHPGFLSHPKCLCRLGYFIITTHTFSYFLFSRLFLSSWHLHGDMYKSKSVKNQV